MSPSPSLGASSITAESNLPDEGTTHRWSIGEAAGLIGVSAAALRLWEQQGLIAPVRSDAGYRVYRSEDLARLRTILDLRNKQGFNAAGIRKMLGDPPEPPGRTRKTNGAELRLGPQLRRLRKQKALSLVQAAANIGLSPSFLSAVERDQGRVSMRLLRRILDFYGTSLQRLSTPESDHTPARLTRAGQRPFARNPVEGVTIEQLAAGARSMSVEIFEIAPGASSQGEYSHTGDEFIFVLEGSLEVRLAGSDDYQLQPGDCLFFASAMEHSWRNGGRRVARILWVNKHASE